MEYIVRIWNILYESNCVLEDEKRLRYN